MKIDYRQHWDASVGLWQQPGPGHSLTVADADIIHPGPNAAAMVLQAAVEDRLDEVNPAAVFAALREMQVRAPGDELYGGIRWYWEEDYICDSNAAFFTGLGLLALRYRFFAALPPSARDLLDDILRELKTYFMHACAGRAMYYPNKYIGDLVCGWLLAETHGSDDDRALVADCFRDAAAYYLDEHWGWGEHLSDGYASVCLDELGALLLFAQDLPADLRDQAAELLMGLLDIEDAFGGGPRVPAIRSYAFLHSPRPLDYRASIVPGDPDNPPEVGNMPKLRALFHQLGWHERFPPRVSAGRQLEVPCFGGSLARAEVRDDIRLGSVSHYPLMPWAEHRDWGLSWQSMPVCFWRPDGDWAYLQWESREDGESGGLPMADLRGAKARRQLTMQTNPPVVGQTAALQQDGNVLVLRVMRPVLGTWEWLADRLRVVGATVEPVIREQPGWSQLLLPYPERTVSVQCLDLADFGRPTLAANDAGGFDWTRQWPGEWLVERRLALSVWGICLHGEVVEAPELTPLPHEAHRRLPEERAWRLRWRWPDHTWDVTIDEGRIRDKG